MSSSNFYIRMLKRFIDNIIVFISALFIGIAVIAIICGDGDKGLLDLLK